MSTSTSTSTAVAVQMSPYEYVVAIRQAIILINSLDHLPETLGEPSDDVVVMAQKLVEAQDPRISVVRNYADGTQETFSLDKMMLPRVVLPPSQDL